MADLFTPHDDSRKESYSEHMQEWASDADAPEWLPLHLVVQTQQGKHALEVVRPS